MSKHSWHPSAELKVLEQRAQFLRKVRDFFYQRDILEVETPILADSTIPDEHIISLKTQWHHPFAADSQAMYLQSSPEFHMKRLLASGSGPIFQISKAFRDGELSKSHNLEFTMLEWYVPNWDHHQLMAQVAEFFSNIANISDVEKVTYQSLFEQYCDFDPHTVSIEHLKRYCDSLSMTIDTNHRNTYLDFILTKVIEAELGQDKLTLVYDYPETMAALATIQNHRAERFEAYWQGVELANGFHELCNSQEQRRRFENNSSRVAMPERFLQCLDSLPPCAGVALGLDRLLMLLLDKESIAEVISFSAELA